MSDDEEELAKLDLLISQAKSDIRIWQKERRAILDEAKSAAQAEFDALIRSALV